MVGNTTSATDLLKTILEKDGYHLYVSKNGEKAIGKAELIKPDLILLDVTSKIDGIKVYQHFKSHKLLKEIPVIILRSKKAAKASVEAHENGCVDYITKPIKINEALGKIRTALTVQKMRKQLKTQNKQLQKEIAEHGLLEKKIKELNDNLESRVQRKTADRDKINKIAYLKYFENMDKVNRAIQQAYDLDQMMSAVLETVLSIFECDRAWLFHPCDPDASSFRVYGEITRPEYPGAKILNVDMPMPQDMAQNLRDALEAADPVTYLAGSVNPINKLSSEQFGVKSMMMVALYPNSGKPWVFGLHQCSYARTWTEEEKRLFKEIGSRLSDSLTSRLVLRYLKESEENYRNLIDNMKEGIFILNEKGLITFANKALANIHGYSSPDILLNRYFMEFIEPSVKDEITQKFRNAIQTREIISEIELPLIKEDGSLAHILVRPNFIVQGEQVIGTTGMIQDITERKKAEAQILKLNRIYAVLSNINQAIVGIHDANEMLNELCRIAIEYGKFRMVWIGMVNLDTNKVDVAASNGVSGDYLKNINIDLNDELRSSGPTGMAIKYGIHKISNNILNDDSMITWRDEAIKYGFKSSAAFPLIVFGKQVGAFNIYSDEVDFFHEDDIKLLDEMVLDISFALEFIESENKRRQTELQLINREREFRTLAENIPNHIIRYDLDCRAIYVNHSDTASKYFTSPIAGKIPLENQSKGSEAIEDYQAKLLWVLKTGIEQKTEFVLPDLTGKIHVHDVNFVAERNIEGEIIGALAIEHDITERKQAEEELQKTHEELKRTSRFNEALLSAIPTPVFYKDKEGRYLGCNLAFSDFMGVTSDQIKGKTVFELWPGEHAKVYHQKDLDLMQNPVRQIYEFKVKHKDGLERPVIYSKDVFRDENDQVIGVVGAFIDISTRKEAEKALQKSETLYRTIINTIQDVFYRTDENGIILIASPSILSLLGYESMDEIIGHPITSMWKQPAKRQAMLDRIQQEGHINDFEVELKKKDGTLVFVSVSTGFVYDETEKIVGVQGIFRDITKRKQVEEALLENEQRFRTVADFTYGWEYWIDTNGNLLYVSPSCERITGYRPEELAADPELLLRMIHPKDQLEIIPILQASFNVEQICQLEFRIITREGLERWIGHISQPVHNESGLWTGQRVSNHDITDRKNAEEALRVSEERYRLIAENTADTIFLFDMNLNYSYISPAIVNLLGYTPDELMMLGLEKIMSSNSWKLVQQTLMEEIEHEKSGKADPKRSRLLITEQYRKDGTKIWVEGTSSFVRDKQGKPINILAVSRDISQRIRVEEELLKSEERFRNLYENAPIGLYRTTQDGKILLANRALVKLLGYSSFNELMERNLTKDGFEPSYEREEFIRQIENKGEIYNLEAKWICHNGNVIVVRESAKAIRDSNGKTLYYDGTIEDITARKRAEEVQTAIYRISESAQAELGLDLLFSSIHTIISELMPTKNFYIALYNSVSKSVHFPYYADEFDSVPLPRKLSRGLTDYVLHTGKSLLATPQVFEQLVRDGHVESIGAHSVDWLGVPLKTQQGETIGVMAVQTYTEDIRLTATDQNILEFVSTQVAMAIERKRAEEELRRLTHAIEQSLVSVVITNAFGDIEYVNPKFTQITGYTKDEVCGKNPRILRSGETVPEQYKQLWETISSGKEWRGEFHNKKKNGELFWETASISPVRNEKSVITHFVAIKEDITERKRVEKELEDYQSHLEILIKERTKELEEVNTRLQEEIVKQKEAEEKVKGALVKEKEFSELKSKFISIASHEFRTPLSVIFSSTELLQRYGRKWNEDQYVEQIERVKFNVHYLTEIMDDVLTISRVDTGKIKFAPKETNLEALCLGLIEDINLLLTKKHQLQFKFALKEKYFMLDERLLKYVLLNLLSNAIKYSNKGGKIIFNIGLDHDNLIFEIEDEGIGIPEKDQSYLFEPFHRGENVGEIQGTGLGMSIVKRSVDVHNGSITFESKVNVGTKFTVKIPV